MNLAKLALKNAWRSPLRALLTSLAVAASVVAFLLLRSLSAGWTERIRQTPNNRVVTRNKIGWDQSMPVHYAEEVRHLPGVKHAMGGRWPSFKNPAKDAAWFSATAVEAEPFVAMHYELVAPAEEKRAFVADRRGLLVATELAQEFGWKVGDTVHLVGTFYPGDWEFHVSSVYRSSRHGFAHRDVWFHWEYLNEGLPQADRDRIDIVSAEIYEPNQGAAIARAVDMHFDSADVQTFSQEDQAMNASLVGRFGALLEALDFISVLVLALVLLIVGNTVAMGVRERTQEYGVLRAIGFGPAHVRKLVLLEATLHGLVGALLGLALGYPLVEVPISRALEKSMHFAPLSVPLDAAALAVLAGAVLALASASVPAHEASRLGVVEALRHVG
ncbi:MAG TPA: ABC transporter permease [Polyangiaceae bacterium]